MRKDDKGRSQMLTTLLRSYLTRSLQPFRFQNTYSNQLQFQHLDQLGLYVHVPFCRSLCSFCPYCKVKYDKELAQAYLQALLQEIEFVGNSQASKKSITTLYFGGGTPALLIDDLKAIIDTINRYFEITEGIGIELHPTDVTVSNLEKLKTAGITMVSLGVQSFEQRCLTKLGRIGDTAQAQLELLAKAGFTVIDVDLIFAIPGQTIDSLLKDVDTAFALGATQVSTYPFIDFTFANNQHKPLSKPEKKQMLQALVEHCRQSGIERTSVWTFAKPGTQKYSSITRDHFLGFGVSAASLLQDQFKINTFSITAYIERINSGQLPTALTLKFTQRQRAVYYLFWSAYTMNISPERFKAVVGESLSKMYGFELWLLEKLGLIYQADGIYYLSDRAAYYYHNLEQRYTTAYIDKMWHIARKEAFPEGIIL